MGEQYVREEIWSILLLLRIMTFYICELTGFDIDYTIANVSQICRPRIGKACCRCQLEYKSCIPGFLSTGCYSIESCNNLPSSNT